MRCTKTRTLSSSRDRNQERSTSISEVNIAVNQMDQVTQQNAAMVEQTTAAAASLSHKDKGLSRQVGHFKIGRSAQGALAGQSPVQARPTSEPPRLASNGGAGSHWREF